MAKKKKETAEKEANQKKDSKPTKPEAFKPIVYFSQINRTLDIPIPNKKDDGFRQSFVRKFEHHKITAYSHYEKEMIESHPLFNKNFFILGEAAKKGVDALEKAHKVATEYIEGAASTVTAGKSAIKEEVE